MSDEEKELQDKVEAEDVVEVGDEVNAEADTGAEAEDEVEFEIEIEEVTEDEATAEQEVAEPAGTALATKTGAGTTTSGNERVWAALAHASVLLTFALGVSTGGLAVVVGALVPLIIWLAFRDKSRFVAFHAMQATVFQLASLVAWVVLAVAGVAILIPLWIVNILLLVVLIGFLLLPVTLVLTVALPAALVAMPLATLVYGLYAAFEVYAGREFRYWLVADWIEKRGMEASSRSEQLTVQPANG